MRVLGIDLSSHAVDLVFIPYDTDGDPAWLRFHLVGSDAFDRARSVAEHMCGPHSSLYDDVLAIGIEDPRGQNAGALYRVQGAILAQLPAHKLVEKWIPSRWRKAIGLPGNCTKAAVAQWAAQWIPAGQSWPQDACDALAVAVATRNAINLEEKAA